MTILALGQMKGGQVLEILLDDKGAKNVPESAARDGHTVLSTIRKGDHWDDNYDYPLVNSCGLRSTP